MSDSKSAKPAPAKGVETKTPAAKAPAKAPTKAPAKAPAKSPAKPAAAKNVAAPHENGDAKARKTREQITHKLQLDIPPARCATHLKSNLIDAEVAAKVKELRAEMKAAKAAGDTETEAKLKKEIAEENHKQPRQSAEISTLLAATAEFTVKELFGHAMDQVLANDTTLLAVEHLHTDAVKNSITYGLIRTLPEWASYSPENEKKLKEAKTKENKERKERAAAKKALEIKAVEEKNAKAGIKAKVTVIVPPPKKAHADKSEEDDDSGPDKTKFTTYTDACFNTIRKTDAKYAKMRASTRSREHASTLIAELIERMATLTAIASKTEYDEKTGVLSSKVRTMTPGHMIAVIHTLLANEGRTEEELEPFLAFIKSKIALHSSKQIEDKQAKLDNMSETKRAEYEAAEALKKAENKKKSIEVAERRRKADEEKLETRRKAAAEAERVAAEKLAALEAAKAETAK